MTVLRPSTFHRPHTIIRRNILSSTVTNKSFIVANSMKSAGFAWRYWRREHNNYSYFWKQLRPYHQYTAGLQNSDRDDIIGTNANNHPIKYNGFSSRSLTSPSPLLSLRNTSLNTTLAPTLLEGTLTNTSFRCMSRMADRSKVDFSTSNDMPHSTSAHSHAKDKGKDEKEITYDSLPASKKAKILFQKYGAVFVGTYFGIYFTTLFSFFVSLDFGLLDPDVLSQIFKVSKNMACETADIIGPPGTGVSMNEAADLYADEVSTEITKDKRTMVEVITGYLQNWDWTRNYVEKLSDNPHLANLALAWFIVKFTEPLRLAAAVIVTPKVAKVLGRKEAKVDAK
mmetsp:Transcript_6906/g.10909  ORF Transcript_6906/g.10909 Transcript_6906/m.10909 type:complete len:340 (+) Transcript_6906:588-1607(+)